MSVRLNSASAPSVWNQRWRAWRMRWAFFEMNVAAIFGVIVSLAAALLVPRRATP